MKEILELPWIDVTNDLIEMTRQQISDNGDFDEVNIHLFLTPMYAPNEIRGDFNHILSRFSISLNYVIESYEETVNIIENNVVFTIGEETAKIYKIDINIDKLRKEYSTVDSMIANIELEITNALVRLAKKEKRIEGKRPELLSRLIKKHQEQVFSSLEKVA